jgi:hypothetical protein
VISDAMVRAINRTVSTEELHRALSAPIGADEREDVRSLVRWFTTRYPTAEDRLAYVRRAYERWRRTAP